MSDATISEMGMEDRPQPQLDAVSRVYWEATKRGELLFQECPACSNRQFYPRSVCTQCGATPEWRTSTGKGRIHTFSVIRQNGIEPFRQWLPYVVAVVQLDEGPRIMGNVVGVAVDDVHIDLPVEVDFVSLNDESSLPFWRPVA